MNELALVIRLAFPYMVAKDPLVTKIVASIGEALNQSRATANLVSFYTAPPRVDHYRNAEYGVILHLL